MDQSNDKNRMAAGIGIAVVVVLLLVAASAFGLFRGNNTTVDTMNGNSTTTPTGQYPEGLQVETLEEGTGTSTAQVGNLVTVHYEGQLQDGTVFDSSYDRGEPFTFLLGAGQVIPGWDIGVAGMRIGEVRELTIAPELAYGSQTVGNIPPNSTLIFRVELLGINEPTEGK